MEMTNKQKTIASITTPLGEGGIGKIIVSGPDALSIVNKMFQGKGIADLRETISQKLYYGYVHDKGERIDEVILHVVRQEDSFTGEDVVEVNCHGGIRVLMSVYECLQSAGAVGVDWGSLLSQSFENDKIDFIQKEALLAVVQARTKLAVKVLLDQYAGALSEAIRRGLEIIEEIRQPFSKEEFCHKNVVILPHPNPPPSRGGRGRNGLLHSMSASVSALSDLIAGLLETAPFGMALTTPRVLVILGKPNVGKSTIINAILGEDQMIVHHEPGTTRDYASEFISIDGIPFELVDTAGMRNTSDKLEAMSIEMTQEQLRRADKVMVVFDSSRDFDQEDENILSALNLWSKAKNAGDLQQRATAHAVVPVINKCDLPAKLDRLRIESALYQPVCNISALNKDGFETLNRRFVQELDTAYKPMRAVVFNKRLYQLLAKAACLVKQKKDCFTAKNKISETLRVFDEVKDIFIACLKGS
ncbi:MAG: 50S ribosome-binding GTPase [Candidatus Brocadia sp.]|nr:50S ribosome-binding GTPase [Candidatus Brocadia sp.]